MCCQFLFISTIKNIVLFNSHLSLSHCNMLCKSVQQIRQVQEKSKLLVCELHQYSEQTANLTEEHSTDLLSRKEVLENLWRSMRPQLKFADVDIVKSQKQFIAKLDEESKQQMAIKRKTNPKSLKAKGWGFCSF